MKPIKFLTIVMLFASTLFVGCNNSGDLKSNENKESKTTFNLEEVKKGVEKSITDFSAAMDKGDAKAAANFYTKDAVFMPNNAPIVTGRENIESALAGFIKAGFTKLKVESTWTDGCGEYFLDTEKWTLSNGKITMIGKSMVIWKKEDGIWKQYKDMISTDNP